MRAALVAVMSLVAFASSAGAGELSSSGPSFGRARAYATGGGAVLAVGDLTGDDYVNGKVVATSKATSWGTTSCGRRVSARPGGACFVDVAGCNDTCARTFAVDELKLWSYAKTDFR